MRGSRAPLLLLLLAPLLAPGCAPQKPANFKELAPQRPEELTAMARESELFVLVTVDAGRRVFFRKEQVGTTDDVGPLAERVRQVIEKNRRAALEKGDEELAARVSTVFISAPPGLTYGQMSKVIDALKAAGGDPIGLQEHSAPR